MIYPSKKTRLAIDAIMLIACDTATGPQSSKSIAQKVGFPIRYLEPIMQRLVKRGILRGVRGPNGGYVLAKDRRNVSLKDICKVLDEADQEEYQGSEVGNAILIPVWKDLRTTIYETLADITLEDLCRQARDVEVLDSPASSGDFTI